MTSLSFLNFGNTVSLQILLSTPILGVLEQDPIPFSYRMVALPPNRGRHEGMALPSRTTGIIFNESSA